MSVLDGPSGQEASVIAFADNFYLPVHLGDARVQAVMWSDDDEGLPGTYGGKPMNARPSHAAWRHLARPSSNGPGKQIPRLLWVGGMTHAAPQATRDAGHGGE